MINQYPTSNTIPQVQVLMAWFSNAWDLLNLVSLQLYVYPTSDQECYVPRCLKCAHLSIYLLWCYHICMQLHVHTSK